MDVLKQFDLEFDDLHACLNTWMSVSPEANEDLQKKRTHMTTASGALKKASDDCHQALTTIDQKFTDLGRAASTGKTNHSTASDKMEKAFNGASETRDKSATATVAKVDEVTDKSDKIRRAVVAFETDWNTGFDGVTNIVTQSREILTAGDVACNSAHSQVGKALGSIKSTLAEHGRDSTKAIANHSNNIIDNRQQTLPKALGQVVHWVSQDLQPGHLAILNGAGQSASQAFGTFSIGVSQTAAQGGSEVTTTLNTAISECGTHRKQLSHHFSSRAKPVLDEMESRQKTAQKSFSDGYDKSVACSQALGELRGKFDAVKKGTKP